MRAAIVCVIAGFVAAASAQTPPRDSPRLAAAGTAVVRGTVVADDEMRAPLRHATVTLTRTGIEDMRSTATDDAGRFTFTALPAGAYQLFVSKGAYIAMSYGAPKPGMPGSAIVLAEGQDFAASPIALMRGAVIAGHVLDRSGRPISTTVEAVQFVSVNGERRRRTTTGASSRVETNAHGEFRIFGLAPGEYLVSASPAMGASIETTAEELAWAGRAGPAPPAGRPHKYAPTFFPGSADEAAAVSIRLNKGEERVGVDFSPQFVPVARVSGLVTGSDSRPLEGVQVVAVPKRRGMALGTPIRILSSRSGADGRFVVADVPPGDYVFSAQGIRPGVGAGPGSTLWGMADATVSGTNLSDVMIRMFDAVAVSGRIAIRGAVDNAPPNLDGIRVRLVSSDSEAFAVASGDPSATVRTDGSFSVPGVRPGKYRVAADPRGQPGVWALRSAVLGGVDYADAALEIGAGDVAGFVLTVADNLPQLSGALSDQTGRPAPQLYVFAFSTDTSQWNAGSRRIASVRTSEAGLYTITGLPPGEYYVCALTELDTTLQTEPSYLEQLVPSSTKITLGEGEKKTQSLRIGG